MKKELIFLIAIVLCLHLVDAGALGMTPTGSRFFFHPYLRNTFSFTVTDSDSEQFIQVYVKGDLKNYTSLDKNSFIGNGTFTVNISLPAEIEIPGNHQLIIGAVESSSGEKGSSASSVGGLVGVQTIIYIFVPYPGQYIEASFEIQDVNEGENSSYYFEINNLGTEDVSPNALVEISKDSEAIKSNAIDFGEIKSKDTLTRNDTIYTSDLKPGVYNVTAKINYGREIDIEKELRVGTLFVNITDYSYLFETNKINKFNIEVENLWNLKMKNVYSEVTVTDNGKLIDSFKTPSVDLEPWEKTNLTGFFNAENLSEGRYIANIQLFYEGGSTGKLAAIYAKNPVKKINKTLIILAIIAAVIILLFLITIIFLIIKIRRIKNEKKRKGNK